MNTIPARPTSMSVHILGKDFRLLWVMALLVALLQALLAYVAFRSTPFDAGSGMQALGGVIMFALTLAMGLSVLSVVHQDSLLADTADWLVRPIRRGDLLLAKLLFMVLVIHVPIFVVNLCKCLAYGFPLLDSLGANLLSNLSIAVIFTLPLTALAAITRNLIQALIGALFAFVVIVVAATSGPAATSGTGIAWVWQDLSRLILLASMGGVLWLQYFRRATAPARMLFAAGLVATLLVAMLPWRTAFGVQRWFSAPAAEAPALSFAPELRADAVAGITLHETEGDARKRHAAAGIGIPLKLSGLRSGELLHTDHLKVRLLAPDGRVVLNHAMQGFELVGNGASEVVLQSLALTPKEFSRVTAQPVRAELEFAFTSLRAAGEEGSVPLNGSADLEQVGHCATRAGDSGAGVEIGCRALIEVPACLGFRLVDDTTPGTEVFECKPYYEPRALRFSAEPLDRVNRSLPAEADLHPGSSVLVRRYEVAQHWSRRVVIPSIALKDFQMGGPAP